MSDAAAPKGNRSTWWILAALIGGLLLGVFATGMGDGLREPAVRAVRPRIVFDSRARLAILTPLVDLWRN